MNCNGTTAHITSEALATSHAASSPSSSQYRRLRRDNNHPWGLSHIRGGASLADSASKSVGSSSGVGGGGGSRVMLSSLLDSIEGNSSHETEDDDDKQQQKQKQQSSQSTQKTKSNKVVTNGDYNGFVASDSNTSSKGVPPIKISTKIMSTRSMSTNDGKESHCVDHGPIIPCSYIAETNLPTDVGHFRLRAYRVDEDNGEVATMNKFVGTEPCVIYCTDKPPFGPDSPLWDGVSASAGRDIPVRIHDQCITSEVFRSKR